MDSVPRSVARFADTYLSSFEDLQVLVSCVDDADRWYDAATIARRLGISRTTARASLDDLARRNLLDIRISGDLRYRFRPGTHELEKQARAFVDAYRKNPWQVAQLIGGLRPKA